MYITFDFFREKFLNFIANYDVIDLPYKKLYSLIKKNLPSAQTLIYVFQFNAISAEEELQLGCGNQDLQQWHVSICLSSRIYFCRKLYHMHKGIMVSED